MKNGLTRRDALKAFGIGGVGAVAGAGLVAGTVTAARAEAPAAQVASSGLIPVGLVAGGYSVVHCSAVVHGAVTVSLRDAAGDTFTALVCAHDAAAKAPATSGVLDVFVANQGLGDTPTVEHHGLAAMALAAALRPYEAGVLAAGVVTLPARLRTFGGEITQET